MNSRIPVAVAAVASLWACGTGANRSPAGGGTSTASDARPQASGAGSGAPAAAFLPEGCDLIPRAEVERLVGALQGEPKREGGGCWYYVAMDTTTAEWKQVRAGAERARAAGMDARAIEMYHPTRAGMYLETDVRGEGQAQERSEAAAGSASATGTNPDGQTSALPAGWDEVRLSPRGTSFYGRTGHVRVTVRLQQLRFQSDTLIAIADRLRDRIPESPIPHPAADRSGRAPPGPDPCSALTREEAEAELGALVATPFRTKERTPLADPSGRSCAYLTAGHRVLVLTPTWEYGRIELDASRMVGGLVRQVADLPGVEGDTLEGPWDEALVDLTGELLLRKGAHALGIRYLMSSTDAGGAIRLAGPALRRLASTPEPARPRVSAGGCLPEATVGELLESPARLLVNMGAAGICNYTLEADPTVQIELAVQPARAADGIFATLQQRVKTARGQAAEAERISVGDGGWAYGTGAQSEAAARRGGKVYHARMTFPLSTTSPDRKDAMVQLVTRMME